MAEFHSIVDTPLKENQMKQIEEMQASITHIGNLKNDSLLLSITDKNGTIVYANKKFCEVSGYTEKEIIGKNHRILKSGFHPPEFYKDMWNTISRGRVWHGEIKNLNKNGTYYWVKTTIVPFLDKNGLPEQYVAIRADITEQKENEQLMQDIIKKQIEEMETSTIRLANLKNALDESSLVSITDKNGTIVYANKKFCEVSGYTEKEIIGKNHRILKSGFHPPEFYKDMWNTISRGRVWHGEIKNLNKNGTYYWVKTTIVPFLDKNGVLEQYIAIRADITEQKELQDNVLKMEKLSAIGELSARIAHDIRNPLSVIKNSFEILQYKNKEFANYNKDDFERIDRAVRRITHQIDDVLDYVRPKSLVLAEKKINPIIQDSLEECVIPKSIIVNVSSDDITLFCDAEKLGIVFTNLIINAIQAMGKTGTIDINCRDDGKNITIKICDTGAGIPNDYIPKIFDPLFTAKQVGTGLGLSSCKSIIEKHKGKIEVESQLGKGTTFIITLPKNT